MIDILVISIIVVTIYFLVFTENGDTNSQPTIPKYDNQDIDFKEEASQVEMVLEEIIPPEPIYQLQTHKIKYLIYNPNYLNYHGSRELYQKIILQNEWLNEAFCSIVFKILLQMNDDELFIQDSNSRVVITNLRGNHNQMKKIKSYQVFSTLEITKSFFNYAFDDVLEFKKDDAQDITLACFLLILSKSKHFETLQNYNLDDLYLENYNRKAQVKHILNLIKTNDNQLKFIQESLLKALNTTCQKPYAEKPNEVLKVQSLPILPQKILMHI